MMDNAAFEALVFERAEEITRRDKKLRVIRIRAVSAAAAVMVLTAVGIIRMPTVSNMSDSTAAPTDYYKSAETAGDTIAMNEPYEDNVVDQSVEQNADFTPTLAVFSNDDSNTQTVTITDEASLTRLCELLYLPRIDNFEESATDVKGILNLSNDNIEYKIFIYNDNVVIYNNKNLFGYFSLTDNTKAMLSELFNIELF